MTLCGYCVRIVRVRGILCLFNGCSKKRLVEIIEMNNYVRTY